MEYRNSNLLKNRSVGLEIMKGIRKKRKVYGRSGKHGHIIWVLFAKQYGATKCSCTIISTVILLDKQEGTVRERIRDISIVQKSRLLLPV